MLSLAALPVPPCTDVTADVVFTLVPVVVAVTVIVNEQLPDGPNVAPLRLMLLPPAGATTAAPPHVPDPPDTCIPAGSVSVKPTPVSVLAFGLLIENCSGIGWPTEADFRPLPSTMNWAEMLGAVTVTAGAGAQPLVAGLQLTIRVKACVALGRVPLEAVNVIGNVPRAVGPGVPESTPVAGLKVTPGGSTPDSDKLGAGVPVAVTVNVPSAPMVNVVVFGLVIAGATPTGATVSVNGCTALEPTPLLAVKVRL